MTSAYFNDAVFIGDSLTTGIQLYNILPDTTVLAAVGVGLENIYTRSHRHRGQQADHSGSRRRPAACQDLCDAGYQRSEGKLVRTRLWNSIVTWYSTSRKPIRTALSDVQSFMPINEQKFEANYGYNLTNAEIDECNEKLMAMAGEEQVYYVDVASAIKDETGGLPAEFTTDGLHFKGEYYNKWIDYLKEHTVPET